MRANINLAWLAAASLLPAYGLAGLPPFQDNETAWFLAYNLTLTPLFYTIALSQKNKRDVSQSMHGCLKNVLLR